MATAVVASSALVSRKILSDEERRWVVVGICLTKILTPALRNVLGNEMQKWHQSLIKPPWHIDKQTPKRYAKSLPPSTIKLNYDSINNNAVHTSPKYYDYAVRDSLSLAKLFVKLFMANFTGFDDTMDPSAALSVTSEAQPFISSGAAGLSRKVRSDIRNEWAHCDFSHWTEANFQTALYDIEDLVKKLGLKSAEEKIALDDLDKWRSNGIKLFSDSLVDCELLDLMRTEVGNLQESVKLFNEDSKMDKKKLLCCLQSCENSLNEEIRALKERQALVEEKVDLLKNQYVSTVQDVEKIKYELAKNPTADDEIPYVFQAPRKNPLFGGRQSELQKLERLLGIDDTSRPKVNIAAICGLGGVGKTSLATEYAQQKKDYYTGGVYWISGENSTAFENSVYDIAARFGTQNDSFAITLSTTLTKISQRRKLWLMILDNIDELDISPNIVKLVSGHWQNGACGHLLIITRRKPTVLVSDIQDFLDRCCLSLECFKIEEGKNFLFRKIGIVHGEDVDVVAEELVKQLGGLPLALEQAGAYIKSLPCTISEYLELYDKQRLRLLDRQKAARVSEYDSHERVAVRTTWHLNFEHIKQAVGDGKAAIRFLYASAFLNSNEIQKDIINVGEPPIEDEEYNECVKTNLGRRQVLKLLTDFSLFKETSHNLSVHHLVQEVIRENLNQNLVDKFQSVVDAIRLLHHAFRHCSSPNELLTPFSDEGRERPSIVSSINPSRFYQWHKLCSHSHQLVKYLKSVVKKADVNRRKIFRPETARIVYECAVHLSANSKHDEAKEVANFAKDILYLGDRKVSASSTFPHTIPLPDSVRRHIQYSCNTPEDNKQNKSGRDVPVHSVTAEQLNGMRMRGNELYKRGFYNEALKIYSDAIDASKNTPLFNPMFLSNRASVYLKLENYDEALQDAEEYILHSPKCWKGYARKTLALAGLNDMQNAAVAASLAYYYDRNVFRDYGPFTKMFDSSVEENLFVCGDASDFSKAVWKMKGIAMLNRFFKQHEEIPVIILEPGNYFFSLSTIDPRLFRDNGEQFLIDSCIFVGVVGKCAITFDDDLHVAFTDVFIAHNINFYTGFTDCHFDPGSIVNLSRCSFVSSNRKYSSFCCKGKLRAEFCKFHDSVKGGLLVDGNAEIENSEFYRNGVEGLQVENGGVLVVRKSKLYANKQGMYIGPNTGKCVVEDCEFYDNERCGIFVNECCSDITIKGNRIYDNDQVGVEVLCNSEVSILDNEIERNTQWGISIQSSSQVVVKGNTIRKNQCGGISLNAVGISSKKSLIEYNNISQNFGPGIHDEGLLTECRENTLHENKERRNQTTTQSKAQLCYCCKKPEKELFKCPTCFTAKYCGENCQKSDWKNHKEVCSRLLSEGSIVLNYVREPIMTPHLPPDMRYQYPPSTATRGKGLLPVGPQYCPPPNKTTRFIAKISAGSPYFVIGKYDPSVVRLYDRSVKIDGILTGADQIHNLVWQHGAMGQLYNDCKKLFMFVQGPENGKLRVFTNEFPPYQHW